MQSVLIDAFKESRPERINFGFKIAVFSIVDNPCDYAKYVFDWNPCSLSLSLAVVSDIRVGGVIESCHCCGRCHGMHGCCT